MSADPLLLGSAPAPLAEIHPRSPWTAGLFALFCPGLGHLYCGAIRASVLWALSPYVAILLALSCGVFVAPLQLHWFVGLAVAGWGAVRLFQIFQVARLARSEPRYALKRYNNGFVYLAFFLGTSAATSLLGTPWRHFVLEPFKIPSSSMVPTLLEGDQVFVTKMGPRSELRRGDVVVFNQVPFDGGKEVAMVKRIIGLPGERVEVRGGVVLVDGVELRQTPCLGETHPSCRREGSYEIFNEPIPDSPPVTVPADSFFLLGDNRGNSYDSRQWGSLPREKMIGRASIIWLSLDPTFRIRWERIGRAL